MSDQDELKASGASRVLADNLDYLLDGISSKCFVSSQRQYAKDFLLLCINCTNTATDIDQTINILISRLPTICYLLSRSLSENDIGVRICLQIVLLLLWTQEKEIFFLEFPTPISIIFSSLLHSCLISPSYLSNSNNKDLNVLNFDNRKELSTSNNDKNSNFCRKRKFSKISIIEKKTIGPDSELPSMKYGCTIRDVSSDIINASQLENNYKLQLDDFIAQIQPIVYNRFPSLFENPQSITKHNDDSLTLTPLCNISYNPVERTYSKFSKLSTCSSTLSIFQIGSALAAFILSETIHHSITDNSSLQKKHIKSKSDLDNHNNYRRKNTTTSNNTNKPYNDTKKRASTNPSKTSIHQQCIRLLLQKERDTDCTEDLLSLLCQRTSALVLKLLPTITSPPQPDPATPVTNASEPDDDTTPMNIHTSHWMLLWYYLSILEGACYHQPKIQDLLGRYLYHSLSVGSRDTTPSSEDKSSLNSVNSDGIGAMSDAANNEPFSSSGILFPLLIVDLYEALTPLFIKHGSNIINKSSATSAVDPVYTPTDNNVNNNNNNESFLTPQPQQNNTISPDSQSSVPSFPSLAASLSDTKSERRTPGRSVTSINKGSKESTNKVDIKTTLTVLDLWQATLKLLGSMTVLPSGMPRYVSSMGSLAHLSLTRCQQWRKDAKTSQLAARMSAGEGRGASSTGASSTGGSSAGASSAGASSAGASSTGASSTGVGGGGGILSAGYISTALSPKETEVDRMIFDCSLLLSSSLTNLLEKATEVTSLASLSSSMPPVEGNAGANRSCSGGSSNALTADYFADSYEGCCSKLTPGSTATPTTTTTTTTTATPVAASLLQLDDVLVVGSSQNSTYSYQTDAVTPMSTNNTGNSISLAFYSPSWSALPGLIWDMLLDETEGFLNDLREGAQAEGLSLRRCQRDVRGDSQTRNFTASRHVDWSDGSERSPKESSQGCKGRDAGSPLCSMSQSKDRSSVVVSQSHANRSETVTRIPVAELILSAHYSLLLHAMSGGRGGSTPKSQAGLASIGTWGSTVAAAAGGGGGRTDVRDQSSGWSTSLPPPLAANRGSSSGGGTAITPTPASAGKSPPASSWWLPLRVLTSFLAIQGLTGELVVDDLPAVLAAISDLDDSKYTGNSNGDSSGRNVRLLRSLRDLDNHNDNDNSEESPYSLALSQGSSRSSGSSGRSDQSTSENREERVVQGPSPYRATSLVPSPLSGYMITNKVDVRKKLPHIENANYSYNSVNNNNSCSVSRQAVRRIYRSGSIASSTMAAVATVNSGGGGGGGGGTSFVRGSSLRQQKNNTTPKLKAADPRRKDGISRDNNIYYSNDEDDGEEEEEEEPDRRDYWNQEDLPPLATKELVDYSSLGGQPHSESTRRRDLDCSWRSRRKFTNREGTFANVATSSFAKNILETSSTGTGTVVCKAGQMSNKGTLLVGTRSGGGSTPPPSGVFDYEDVWYS